MTASPRTATVGLGVLAALTVARAYHAPGSYALGHWLLTYEHGFVKRGLVGTLAAPLLAWKSPDEVRFALETVASGVTLALIVAFAVACAPLLKVDAPAPTRVALATSMTAFACSGWLVFAGHTNGFFDHLLEVAVLAVLPLVGTRLRFLVPVIALAALATHEVFLVYGLPVLVFATWAAAPPGPRAVAVALAELLAPIALGVGAVALLAGFQPADAVVDALRQDVAAYGVLGGQAADNAVFHLTQDLVADLATPDTFYRRLARLDLLRAALPNALLGSLWAGLWLWPSRRGLVALLPAVLLTPLALHLVAWDTPRFTLMVVFHALALWLAAARGRPAPELSPRVAHAITALAALVIANDLLGSVPLMQDDRDGDGVLAPRLGPSVRSLSGCSPAFTNADFERSELAPWRGTDAFVVRSGVSRHGGRAVIGSFGRRFLRTGDKDEAIGTLLSPKFKLTGDTLLIAVGGGQDPERLRASLYVDDTEIAWATGTGTDELAVNAWEVAAWRGREARIAVVDDATGRWGHLDVDHVCTFRGAR